VVKLVEVEFQHFISKKKEVKPFLFHRMQSCWLRDLDSLKYLGENGGISIHRINQNTLEQFKKITYIFQNYEKTGQTTADNFIVIFVFSMNKIHRNLVIAIPYLQKLLKLQLNEFVERNNVRTCNLFTEEYPAHRIPSVKIFKHH
ncbi:hypothetical protein L9F63_015104, partial [Diploptera punctata]